MNVEAWRKNENTASFDHLVKGALLTVEGYFKPEEWQDAEGIKHNRVILVVTKFYEAVEKENVPDSQQGKTQKDLLILLLIKERPSGRFFQSLIRSDVWTVSLW